MTNLRAILFEDPSHAAEQMADALRGQSLGRMPDAAKKAVLDRVATAADGMLDMDVTDIFGMAWRKQAALREAAAATLAEPGSTREVQMASHTVSFGHEPAVEVWLAERRVATIVLRIGLELRIRAVVACVRQGRLTALAAGTCDAEGTLELLGTRIAHRQVTLALPVSLRLGRGLPLTDDVTSATVPS